MDTIKACLLHGVLHFQLLMNLQTACGLNFFNLTCNNSTGLSGPPPLCELDNACTELLGTYKLKNMDEITTPQFVNAPRCTDLLRQYDDGPMEQVQVELPNGQGKRGRHYCMFKPQSSTRLPLLIWIPGSGANASDVYRGNLAGYSHPRLRQKAETFPLMPDAKGYVFISAQALNHHWPGPPEFPVPEDGTKFDFIFRNYESNEDFAFIDTLIDTMVEGGSVDPRRVYMMGWSNGAYFAQAYAIVRSKLPTKGGNRVTAVAVYSAANPFGGSFGSGEGGDKSCALAHPPTTTIPLMLVSHSCDVADCSTVVLPWMKEVLPHTIRNPHAVWLLLNDDGTNATECKTASTGCTPEAAVLNHLNWPSSREDDMLRFLAESVGESNLKPSIPTSSSPKNVLLYPN